MISFIIVNYNSADYTIKLISDIKNSLSEEDYEIIIVDNASKDSDIEKLQRIKDENVHVMYLDENVGFGAANNLGAKKARGDIFVLVNPDIEIPGGQDLGRFIKNHLTPEVGILAPKIIWPNGVVQPNCQKFSGTTTYIFRAFKAGYILRRLGIQRKIARLFVANKLLKNTSVGKYFENYVEDRWNTRECDWVSGAFMILRKELYEKLGGFDEDFFLYVEDEDFCRRARKLGVKVVQDRSLVVIHHEGGSQNASVFRNHRRELTVGFRERYRGSLYYVYKHGDLFRYFVTKLVISIELFIKATLYSIMLDFPYAKSLVGFSADVLKYKPKDTVALVGYYAYGSFGDELILKAFLQKLYAEGKEVIVLSRSPRHTSSSLTYKSVGKFNLVSVLLSAFSSTELIIGGGGLFNRSNTRSYLYYTTLCLLWKVFKRKVHVSRVGIEKGALKKKLNRFLLGVLLKSADTFSVRDPLSYDEVTRYFGKMSGKVSLQPDIVVEYFKTNEKCFNAFSALEKKKIVGITVTRVPNLDYSNLVETIKKFASEGYSIRYFVSNIGEDLEFTKHFSELYKLPGEIITFQDSSSNIDDFCKSIVECEIVISMRLHVSIVASECGSRCIVVPWNSKLCALAEERNLETVHLTA